MKEQTIIATMIYEDTGKYMPTIRNIEVRNMTVKQVGKTGILLEGYPESPVQHLLLINVKINGVETPYKFTNAKDIQANNVMINGEKVQFEE